MSFQGQKLSVNDEENILNGVVNDVVSQMCDSKMKSKKITLQGFERMPPVVGILEVKLQIIDQPSSINIRNMKKNR